jgi:hypothetical protein
VIPRYIPAFPSFGPSGGQALSRERVFATLVGESREWHDYAFSALRHGLHSYFAFLRANGSRNTVLMSAQICPLVPLAAQAAGLRPRFVDIAEDAQTPEAQRFADALDETVAAVLVAPFYGQVKDQWSVLTENLRGARLILDLAQGVGLRERVARLLERADAVGFSFGLGKGVDTGGSLFLTRSDLGLPPGRSGFGRWPMMKAATLWFLATSRLYSLIPRQIIEDNSSEDTFAPQVGPACRIPDYRRWARSLAECVQAIGLARMRAKRLSESSFASRVKCRDVCFDPGSTHLRQILRLEDSSARDGLLRGLRRAGIDCAPAGEPLPFEYLESAGAITDFPNARRFRAEALRLPFLGRLRDSEFDWLRTVLEREFGRLPH